MQVSGLMSTLKTRNPDFGAALRHRAGTLETPRVDTITCVRKDTCHRHDRGLCWWYEVSGERAFARGAETGRVR